MLKQKSAIVTGSTSGIGLGIARAFAAQGADVMLNGFGNADEIEFTRAEMERTHRVKVRYSGADMSQARADPRAWPSEARGRVRQGRHRRQQRRHPARRADRGVPGGEVGRDRRDQPVVGVPPDQGGRAGDEGAPLRPHRQHRLGARPDRIAVQGGVRDCQARPDRPVEDGRARSRRIRHHVEHDLPGLREDAAGRPADRRPGEGARHLRGRRRPRRAARAPGAKGFRPRRRARRARGLPRLRRRRVDDRRARSRWTAAGPSTDRTDPRRRP